MTVTTIEETSKLTESYVTKVGQAEMIGQLTKLVRKHAKNIAESIINNFDYKIMLQHSPDGSMYFRSSATLIKESNGKTKRKTELG